MSVSNKQKALVHTPTTGGVSFCRATLLRVVFGAAVLLAGVSLQGCGSGGGGTAVTPLSQNVSVTTAPAQATVNLITTNYLQITASDYRFAGAPTFYYSTDNQNFWSIQANIAQSVTDISSRTVIRIDIPKTGAPLPQLNRTFAIEAGTANEPFPGSILVLDGQQSTKKRVETGTITFTPDSIMADHVSGSFDVVFVDNDAAVNPAPRYFLKGVFSFKMGGYGPAV